jgi:hypothetical protein
MNHAPMPRMLIAIRAVATDPDRRYPDADVPLVVETTADPHLGVGTYPVLRGPNVVEFGGDFAVIHIPSGLAITASITHSVASARNFAAHLATTAVDWSRTTLSEDDDELCKQIKRAAATYLAQDTSAHLQWEAV